MTGDGALQFHAATHTGRVRGHNEDNFLVDRRLGLFVVADGMGGHNAGEVASALCVRTVHDEVKRHRGLVESYAAGQQISAREVVSLLEHAAQRASAVIHDEASTDPEKRGMGTTCVMLLVAGPTAFVAHAGDSRVYLRRDDKLECLTDDHTVYNELVRRGKLSLEQIEKVAQKNAITRAVGIYERVEVDTLLVETVPGDTFLLCSDGLHGYVRTDDELGEMLSAPPEGAVEELVRFANDRGGRDNVTAVVVRIGGEDDGERARKLAQKRAILAKMPLFSRLSERELLRVLQVVSVRAALDGEEIIQEGERGDALFVVLSGTLRVSQGGAVLSRLGEGAHVGEMALIRNEPRSATVTSEGPSELAVITRVDFLDIVRRDHELAIKLLWQFLGVLAGRLDGANRQLRSTREGSSVLDEGSEVVLEDESEHDRPTLPFIEPA